MKYRILRNGHCICEDLTVHNLKRHKKEVTKIDKGVECGISFDGFKGNITLEEGDILECYTTKIAEPDKFEIKAGLKSSS